MHSYRRCLQLFGPLFAVVFTVVTSPALADGTVRAWGLNDFGQCNIPADLGVCTQIAGGKNHTIALRVDGTVRAWGWNQEGQCNIPSTLGVCTQIAGGHSHTIALQYNNPCPADITPTGGDGVVNGSDLAALLSSWATSGAGDINADGIVDGVDLTFMLGSWGNCP